MLVSFLFHVMKFNVLVFLTENYNFKNKIKKSLQKNNYFSIQYNFLSTLISVEQYYLKRKNREQ